MLFSNFNPADLLFRIPALLWALSFHEFCHGWTAYKLGDNTAAYSGRLSLNPIAHLDIVGTLMLLFVGFGWAKPVPINSRNFRNPRRDITLVSLAGPCGNFITALACGILINLFPSVLLGSYAIKGIALQMLYINIGLGVFNLIPIPPLDGAKPFAMLLPASYMDTYFFLERYGIIIILGLSFTQILPMIMYPIMNFLLRVCLFQF